MVLLTAKEASAYLGISETTFWRMRKDCPIKERKGFKRCLYEPSVLDAWVLETEKKMMSSLK